MAHPLTAIDTPGFGFLDEELETIKRQVDRGFRRFFRKRGLPVPTIDNCLIFAGGDECRGSYKTVMWEGGRSLRANRTARPYEL